MQDDIFISYSRRDAEYVIKLASDLDQMVAGVWFDQSNLAVGQKWRAQISSGIQNCKVFVLVLSPDSIISTHVRDEVDEAVSLHKIIIPVLYRPCKLKGKLKALVHETQFLDLSLGSYADNFQKLVDGLVAAGIARQITERPFIFQPVQTNWEAVLFKIPQWALAWGLGWALFWFLIITTLALVNVNLQMYGSRGDAASIFLTTFSGTLGGLAGGLLSGIISMLALRRYAPSVAWKHMWPSIPIWVISGPMGLFLSIFITVFLSALGLFTIGTAGTDCSGLTTSECAQQLAKVLPEQPIGLLLAAILALFLVAMIIWFLVGLFAGWLAVLNLRRLEPGIQRKETLLVAAGWGFGATLGAFTSLIAIVLASIIFGV